MSLDRSVMTWYRLAAVLGAAGLIFQSAALAQEKAVRGAEDPMNPCGIVYMNVYGPYDYRTDTDKLKIVEDFHFTPQVEALRAGQSGYIGGDLNYTLHSFPNHHRALVAMVRLTEKKKSDKVDGMAYPMECYFDRAIRFRPDDTKVRSLYAQYLHKNKRKEDALRQLAAAEGYAGDSGVAHYNIGLVYYQLGEYEKAVTQARRAKDLGVDHKQLETLLRKAGQWKDPAN